MATVPPPAVAAAGQPSAGQPTQLVQAPQQTIILNPSAQDQRYVERTRTCARALKVTGILQIVFGCLAIVLGVVAVIIKAWFAYYVTPIWMGLLLFMLTGIIGVHASKKMKRGLRVVYLVLSIFASIAAFPLIVVAAVGAASEGTRAYHDYHSGSQYYGYYHNICNPGRYEQIVYNCGHKIAGRQAVDALIAFTAFFEMIVALVAASYACCATCRCCCYATEPLQNKAPQARYYVGQQPGQQPGQVYVQVPQGACLVQPAGGYAAGGMPMYVAQQPYAPMPAGGGQQYVVVPPGQQQQYIVAPPGQQYVGAAPPQAQAPAQAQAPPQDPAAMAYPPPASSYQQPAIVDPPKYSTLDNKGQAL